MTPRRVLVVDDDAGNRKLLGRMLQLSSRVQVVLAADGPSALALALEQPFDVVLLDIHMPGMDGETVCRQLRMHAAYRDCTIMACTAHAGHDEQNRFLAQGFSSILTKPFMLQELYRALDLPLPPGF